MRCKKIILTNLLIGVSIYTYAFNSSNTTNDTQQNTAKTKEETITTTTSTLNTCKNAYSPLSIKWYQHSSEIRALYRQIFSMSKQKLLANKKLVKPGTVCGTIFDIDETLIDNSQHMFELSEKDWHFTEDGFEKFINQNLSIATPGASEITHYIHSIGCKVNIVSNRIVPWQKATEASLRKNNIYFDQIILAPDLKTTDKNLRFQAIENGISPAKIRKKQTIIAYYGDNIQDFPDIQQSSFLRNNKHGNAYNPFGNIYFVLPNPIYGSWNNSYIIAGSK